MKKLLKEHKGFSTENVKASLEDNNRTKECVKKCLHNTFEKLAKFAELQLESSARKSNLSENPSVLGVQSLNNSINRFITEKWKFDDTTNSNSDNEDKIILSEKDTNRKVKKSYIDEDIDS